MFSGFLPAGNNRTAAVIPGVRHPKPVSDLSGGKHPRVSSRRPGWAYADTRTHEMEQTSDVFVCVLGGTAKLLMASRDQALSLRCSALGLRLRAAYWPWEADPESHVQPQHSGGLG
jgi:hypothetical protein